MMISTVQMSLLNEAFSDIYNPQPTTTWDVSNLTYYNFKIPIYVICLCVLTLKFSADFGFLDEKTQLL